MKVKLLLWLIFVCLTSNLSFGQTYFNNEANFNYYSDSLLLDVGIQHPDFDETTFEFRYWIRDLSRHNAHQLVIIQQAKNKNWKLKRYQICFNDSQYKIIDSASADLPEWETTWKALLKQGILDLKSEALVQHKWKSSKGEYILTADGTLYGFELITKKLKRHYVYTNPYNNLQTYDLNNIELVRVTHIISILEKQLNLNANIKSCSSL